MLLWVFLKRSERRKIFFSGRRGGGGFSSRPHFCPPTGICLIEGSKIVIKTGFTFSHFWPILYSDQCPTESSFIYLVFIPPSESFCLFLNSSCVAINHATHLYYVISLYHVLISFTQVPCFLDSKPCTSNQRREISCAASSNAIRVCAAAAWS